MLLKAYLYPWAITVIMIQLATPPVLPILRISGSSSCRFKDVAVKINKRAGSKHEFQYAVLKRGSGFCAFDDLQHSSLNLVVRQNKLHNIFIFGMAYSPELYSDTGMQATHRSLSITSNVLLSSFLLRSKRTTLQTPV